MNLRHNKHLVHTDCAITLSLLMLTSSLSKYWMSSGLRKGRFPEGWSFICFVVRSSACIWKPVMPPMGVGVAASLRAGVRIGT